MGKANIWIIYYAFLFGFGAGGISVIVGMPGMTTEAPNQGVSVLPTAQAGEEKRVDLFALGDPRDACTLYDRAIAWKRDDSFATRLTVWCLEEPSDSESNKIVAWEQSEGAHAATRRIVQNNFYRHQVLRNDEDKKPFVAACNGDGFLGWGKGSSWQEGGAVRIGEGDHVQITGFYGGLVWCVGDDLYALSDGKINDGNPYDHRFDIADGVETE